MFLYNYIVTYTLIILVFNNDKKQKKDGKKIKNLNYMIQKFFILKIHLIIYIIKWLKLKIKQNKNN